MVKVYGYARVSTTGQAEDGDSLETQEKKIQDYCKTKGLELLTVYKDGGVSGAIEPRKRPQCAVLLASLDAGNADGLVVCKIDRISRSTKDYVNLIYDFKDKFNFYCLSPDLDCSSVHGKFAMTMMAGAAELERDMTKERVKDVMNMKKKKGERVGSVPYGKQLIEDSNLLEDHPEEQRTILIAKELREIKHIKNGKSVPSTLKEICKELTKRERVNKEGKVSWFPSQVRRMLHDGDYTSGRVPKEKKEVKPKVTKKKDNKTDVVSEVIKN